MRVGCVRFDFMVCVVCARARVGGVCVCVCACVRVVCGRDYV